MAISFCGISSVETMLKTILMLNWKMEGILIVRAIFH